MSYKYDQHMITATEFKKNLGKYIDYVIDNHELVITKNGHPSIRVAPYMTEMEQYMRVNEEAIDYGIGGTKVSYEEFVEIYEKSELRLEYINGEIIVLASPSPYHQDIARNLLIILHNYLKGKPCKAYFAPFDCIFIKMNKKTGERMKTPDVCQPDLLIACDVESNLNERDRYAGVPKLAVEILSPSTRSKDMVDKLNTYMLSDVEEFWIVDPIKKRVIQYSFINYDIDEYNTYKLGESFDGLRFPGLTVSLEDVFEA